MRALKWLLLIAIAALVVAYGVIAAGYFSDGQLLIGWMCVVCAVAWAGCAVLRGLIIHWETAESRRIREQAS